MRPFLKVLVPFYLIFIIHNYVFAEGTKQVQPIAANACVLDLLNGTSTYKNWGTYLGTGVDERIHIHIKNFANERIYWGLNQITAGNLYYRIKDPSGTIVVGPSLVPTVGLPGYINTYAEAVAGPSALAGGGYNALSYNPLMNGDYYIEFNFGSPTAASGTPMQFNYFDFTVSDLSTSQPILGRLWSEAWGLNTNAAATPANSVFYVYTADSVVTTLDMNGMNPFGFSVVCNKTGVTNSGVVATDRKSVINKVLYASYKIFLNNPDPSEYPSGISATLSSTPQVTGCPSGGTGYCIEIFPSKPCQSDVFLDFNGNGVYDAGTRDVLFSQNLSAGYNCVPWNGKDGLGTLVTAGLSITINIKVISGLTNFPIFDAEFDNNGVKVAIVRPALPPPLVFWDDSGLLPPTNPGGIANSSDVTTNLTGSASPAHKWDNNANVNNSVANGNGFGNNRTINTWWYTYSLNTNLSYTVTNACPPVGTNDVVATCLNSPVTFNPLANDTDPENNINPSSVTVSTAPKHGGTVINAGGTITYTPTAGYTDYDTLAYSVCDFSTPTPLCTTATVFITVNPTFTLSKTDYCGAAAIGTISFATTVNTLKYDYTAGATYTGPVPPTANTSVVGTNTISALAGGTYTVRLHNPALGCFTDKTITIVANANPTLTLSKSDVCGAGNTTGIITFPTGVTTLKYDYSAAASYTGPVPPSAFASVNGTNTIGGLAAGTYTVRLYNPATGCFTDQSITINTIATVPPTLTLSKTDVCGATTGKISFPTTVTTLRYNYTSGLTYTGVTPATATINGTNNITPLAAGTYTVRLRDPASGCFTDGTISVVDNNPVLSIATTNICGAGTGTLSFATPVATYKYDKTAGATYTGPVPPAAFTSVNGTNTIAGLAAGTYTVRLYNPGNTCFVDKSATIIGGTNPTLTLTKADICTSAVGGITFPTTVTTLDYGYTAGATYTGPNPPASSTVNGTNSIINLSAGTYTVRLTDPVSGCFTDASSTIADNRPAYSGNITKTDACGAALGSISFPTASAAFKYNYTSGATYTGGVPATATIVGTNVIANTGAGIFTIRLYNPGNTCYKDSTKSVNNNNPTLGLSATDVCGAATNGTISFGTTVNTYKYDKSIGATYTGAVPPAANTSVVGTNTISALAANTYTVRLHDPATGCFKDQTITVNSNPNPTLTLSKTDACAAAANGTITFPTTVTTLRYNYTAGASYTGGIPATATVNGTNTISTLTSGTYTVRLYNPATACFTDQTIVVNSITTPTLTLSSGAGTNVQSACVNVTALTSITYTVGGGATGASVSGLPAGLTTNFAAGTFTISGTPTASGTFNYTVSTTGMAPCAAATATGTITVIATPTIALSSGAGTNVQSACVNVTALTSITYTVGGGATGASVSGLPAGLTTNFAAGTFTISGTPTASGTFNYTVSTTGMAPCAAATATGTITVIATPTIALSSGAGTNVQSACVNVTALTSITYTVGGGATGASASGLPAGLTTNFAAGTFTISGTPTASGTFNYTVSTTGMAPCAAATATGTITVIATPTIALSSGAGTNVQSACVNVTALTSITYTVGGGATGASASGLPAGLTTNFAAGTFTISGTPTASGTFNYTVSTTGMAPCAAATATGTITVIATPTLTLSSGAGTNVQSACVNVTALTSITYTVGGGATGASASGLPAGLTTNFAAGTFTISGTPTASGTFNYTVSTTGMAPCAAATATGTITVIATPTIALSSGAGTNVQSACVNVTALTSITYTVGGGATGASVSGLPAGLTTNFAAGTFTISGTPTASGTFNYTVSTTGMAPCAAATATGTITVIATPTLTLSSGAGTNVQSACVNVTALTSITYTVGGGATGASVSGLPAGLTTNFAAGTFTISGTPTASGTFNYTVSTTGMAPCAAATATGTITVIATPTIALSSGAGTNVQSACVNVTALTSITYTVGGGATGASASGLPAGLTTNFAAGTFTISGTPTASGTFNYTVSTTGMAPCAAATATGTITVIATPTIALSSGAGTNVQSACVNVTALTSITYTVGGGATGASASGLPAGLTTNFAAGTFTISGTPTASGTFNYTVSTTGMAPCAAATATGTITVIATPTIALSSGAGTNVQSACVNVTALTSITYTVGGGATGASASGLPAGLTTNFAAGTFTISGTPTASGTFNYTVSTTGMAPCAAATATGTITVIATPTLTLSSGAGTNVQSACVNVTVLTSITYTVGGGATGASVSGLPAGLTTNFAAGTFTISGTPTASGTFNYTVSTTGMAPCAAATATGTITVIATPTIALSSGAGTNVQSACVNVTALTSITYTVGGGATGASASGLPAGLTTNFAAGTFTISGTPTASGTFNYTVSTTGMAPCAAATATGTITVIATPTIALSSAAGTDAQTKCINTVITNITYTIGGGATGASVSGLPAGLTTNFAAGTFTISGTPTVSGTFNYTVSTTGMAPCAAATATGTITINPNAAISLTSAGGTNAQTLCANNAITDITYAITGGGTGGTVTGLPTGVTGSFAGTTFTITGTPTVSGTFNYTVNTTGTCAQTSATGTIIVNPNAAITLTSAPATTSQTLCANNAITNITYSVTGGGTGAGVTGLPAGINGSFSGGVFTISGTTASSGTFPFTVTTSGTCAQATATGTITINPNAAINLTSAGGTNAQTLCANNAITDITYAITGGGTGGTVTGLPTGVNGSFAGTTFTISGTPTASGTFNYTVNTTGTCAQTSATGTIIVNPNAAITLTSAPATTAQTLCASNAITNITYSVTGGGTGAGVTGLPAGINGSFAAGVFTISGTTASSGTFNYTVTTSGTCAQATATGTITINPNAAISLTSAGGTNAQTLCANNAITDITYAITGGGTGGTVSGLPTGVTGSFAGTTFTISGTPTVSGTFNYTVNTTGTCAQTSATGTIIVNPNAVITLTSAPATTSQTLCANNAITNITYSVTGGGTGAGVTGLPAGINGSFSGGVFTISGTTASSGTFPFTVTTSGTCAQATATGTITINPNAAISLTSAGGTNAQTLCANNAITNITYAITGGGTGGTVSGLPTGVTGSFAGTTFTITGTPTVSGTFNYTVNTTGTCAQTSATGTIIVNPNAAIALTSAAGTDAQTLCANNPIVNITYSVTGGGTGAGVTGLPAGINGSFSGGVFTISGTTASSGSFPFTVTTSGTCAQATATGTITINPNAAISLTSAGGTNAQTLCANNAITNITYAITGGGTGGTVSGLPTGVTGSFAGTTFTVTGTPTVSGTFNYTVNTTGTCAQTSATGTIIVNPNAAITLTSAPATTSQTLCANNAITNITYSVTGGGTGAGVTGLPAGINGNFSAGVFTISGTTSSSGTFNYTVTTSGTCAQATATGTITINPNAAISLTSAGGSNAQALCANNAITDITYAITGGGTGGTVTGLPTGVTGSFAGTTFTVTGTPTVSGTFNYTVNTTGTCAQTSATGSIIVNPNAAIALTSAAGTDAQTLCANNPIVNITYSVTGGGTGAGVTGLPAGINGSFAGTTFTISGTTSSSGSFPFTVTTSGTCAQATATGTITINPNAAISLTSAGGTNAQTLCANNAITDITYAITGGGTGGTVTGLPAGVNGSFAGTTFTISGTPTVSGTFNYTVNTTGTCAQTSATGTIIVNPNAAITLTSAPATTSQTLCANNAITNITYSVTGGGTGAGVTGLPAGINGNFSAGVFTISGTTASSGTFNYTVTTSGTCAQATATGTITINPNAAISLTSAGGTNAQTLCANNAITDITYAITGGGTGGTVSGLPTGVTGSFAGTTFTISGTPTVSGTFNYTVNTTGTCAQTSATGTIIVNPNAAITLTSAPATTAQTLCASNAITNITYSVTGGGTGAGVTGLPAGINGSFVGTTFTISGTTASSGTFPFTVTTSGTCAQATATGTITINPNAAISLTSAGGSNAQTLCANNAITNITYAITGGGTGGTVSGLPTGVTGSFAGTTFTISGTPTVSGTFNYTVNTTGTCAQTNATGTIIVNPNAAITLTSAPATTSQTLCANNAITNITYSVTGGGTGAGVTGLPAGINGNFSAGVFTISGTTSSSGTFNYTVTTSGTCAQATATGTITINPNAAISLTSAGGSNAQTLCANNAITDITYAITGGGTGGTVSGLPTGVTGSFAGTTFTISGTPTASGIFNYTVNTTGTCAQTSATGTIIVNPNAAIALTSAAGTDAQTLCANNPIVNITYSVTGGGTGAGVTGLPAGINGSFSGGVFTISGTTASSGSFPFTVTTSGTCAQATATGTITINPNAAISLTSAGGTNAQTLCANNAITDITYAITGGGTGGTVSGLPTGVTGSFAGTTFTITGTPTVSGTFNYTVNTTGTCAQTSATGTIIVNPNAAIALTSAAGTDAQTLCANNPITNITYSVTGGGTGAGVSGLPAGINGSFAAGVFTISGTTASSGTFNYTVTTSGTCAQTTINGSITVNPNAAISLTSAGGSNAQTLCALNPITDITYAITGGGTGGTVSGLPTGVTGSFAGTTFTITGTPTVSGTFNYTVNTTGTCAQTSATGTIIVNPNAAIALTSAAGTDAQTLCANNPIVNITYSVTGGGTGAGVSGLPAGINGSFAAGVFTISGTTSSSGTFNYTVTTSGTCAQTTINGSITVNPNAAISLTSAGGSNAQTLCALNPITDITYAITGGGTGGTVSGLPAGVTGSFAGTTFTISGTPTASGTFNYTVNTTGTCAQTSATGTIIVNPNAAIALTSAAGTDAQTLCANNPIVNITYSVTGGGTGAGVSGLPAGINGSFAAGVFTISGTTASSGTFNYTVTTSGTCAQTTINGSITVNPNAAISLTSAGGSNDQTLCALNPITDITYAITGGGTGGTVSGLPTGVTGSFAGTTFTITGTPTVSGTFNYTVNTTGTCAQTSATGTIIVNPNAAIALTSAAGTDTQTLCANNPITNITYSVTGGGTGAGVSGLPAGINGSFAAGVFTISGTTSSSGTFNYTVTTSGTCAQTTINGSITINPNAAISLTSAGGSNAQTLCALNPITDITYAITGGGTGGTVSGLPAGVTGSFAGTTFTITGTPTASGTFNYTVNTTGTCAQTSATGSIIVNPNAAIALTSAAGTDTQTLCANNPITNITYSVTGGGTGAGVSGLPAGINGSFAGTTFTISGTTSSSGSFPFTVTTSGTCAQTTINGSITINPNAAISLTSAGGSNAQTLCANNAITNITYAITGGGTGGTVSGLPTGVTGSFAGTTFTVTGTPTVSGTFNYTVNTTGTCAQTSATGSITVNPNQAIALTSAAGTNTQTLCAFNPITNITYSISGGGTGGGITGLPAGVNGTFSAGVFTISGTPSASGPFNYTITTSGTCAPTSASGSITVNPKPALTITDPSAVCSPLTVDITAASVTAGSFMAGGTLSYWTNAAATSALASPNAVSSTGTYYIKAGTGAGCMDIKAVNVVVNPTPSLQITNPIAVCAPFTVDITPAFITTGSNLAGGSLSYWTDAGATIVLATPSVIATTGTYYIKASTAAGCMDIKPVAVTVNTNCNNIGLAMQAAAPVPTGNGSYTITYTINVGNYSVVPITNIAVTEDLNSIFPAPATFSVVSVSATGSLIANNALSGVNTGVVNLLASGSTLPLSGSEQITFVINVFPNTSPGPYYNSAIGTAMASLIPLTDSSSLGTNPDPNANGNPGDPGEAVPTPVALPTLTLFIPEGFSPNGDGVHDTFFIENMSGMKASMEIFNRWGEVVFKANDYKNDWDGKCNIGLHFGNELPDGTYYYVIELSDGTKVARYITLYR